MGSGGPRGLQILRSGANSVRGGFDSHAFPPTYLTARPIRFAAMLAVLAAIAWITPTWAQIAARSDSTVGPAPAPVAPGAHVAPDSTAVIAPPAAGDTTRSAKFRVTSVDTVRRLPPTDPTGFDRPKWVMFRSLVFPGWGQAHNGAWAKAIVIAGVEGLFIGRVVQDKVELNRIDGDISTALAAHDSTRANDLTDQFNSRSNHFVAQQWWLGAVLAYSLLDAYIDAHFRNFRVDLEDDPALPPEERRAAGLKLSWQVHF